MQTLGPVMRLFLVAIQVRDDDSLDKKKKKSQLSMPAIHSVLAVCTSSKWAWLQLTGQRKMLVTFHIRLLLGSFKFPPNDLVMRNDHKAKLQYIYILIISR